MNKNITKTLAIICLASASVFCFSGNVVAEGHAYYKGLTLEQARAADGTAKAIAEDIMNNPYLKTDLQRVEVAAQTVAQLAKQGKYGIDDRKYYRSPFGVFVSGNYTCAGTTRALGRILDYMGFEWKHVNPNVYRHQWNILVMDGQIGFADGMGGWAGYGVMRSGMTLPNGTIIRFPE